MPDQPNPDSKDDVKQWFRTSSNKQPGVVINSKGKAIDVEYAVVDGLAILEGDIELGTHEEAARFRRAVRQPVGFEAVGITGEQFRWPNGIVPYVIDANLPNQHRVTLAIEHWEARTPLKFPKRTSEKFYLRFQVGGGCSSRVGMQELAAQPQPVRLAAGCLTGSVIHEIGHAIGLWHEQSREDRDQYVDIIWDNIEAAMQFNFHQQIDDGFDIGEYDYNSIMHYPRKAFSKNGEDTIIPKGGEPIGQRDGLSAKDIAGVKVLYPNLDWSNFA